MQKPDAPVMRALAVLPGTSSTVMTARLVLSDVAAWEALVAVLLLVLAILVLRRIAGKVFAAGILLTGKELSWREAWRALVRVWARRLPVPRKNGYTLCAPRRRA